MRFIKFSTAAYNDREGIYCARCSTYWYEYHLKKRVTFYDTEQYQKDCMNCCGTAIEPIPWSELGIKEWDERYY